MVWGVISGAVVAFVDFLGSSREEIIYHEDS